MIILKHYFLDRRLWGIGTDPEGCFCLPILMHFGSKARAFFNHIAKRKSKIKIRNAVWKSTDCCFFPDMSEVLRDFQCKSCLRILGSRAALQRHLKEVHHRDMTGSCSCDRCGKTFQNRSNLKIHMLTHSGIKPFRYRIYTPLALSSQDR